MTKRNRSTVRNVSLEQTELAVNFYDVANDHPNESFVQIAKRVMPREWARASASLKREARRMFNLAR